MAADTALMEKLTALCKRRGFIYPGSEIYGGIGGFWDYGPLGVEVKQRSSRRCRERLPHTVELYGESSHD